MRMSQGSGERLIKTILASGFAFFISYIINFLLTPYITDNIGSEAYGFITLAKTFASYAMIFAIAVNSYAARYITVEYHQSNYRKANEYFGTTVISNFIIACAALLFSIIFAHNINSFLVVSEEIVNDVRLLFILIFINFGLTCMTTAFSSSYYIANRLDLTGNWKTVGYFVEAGVLLVLYTLLNPRIYYVGIALICQNLLLLLANMGMTRKLTKEIHISEIAFSISAARQLIMEGIWNSINAIGNTLNTGLDLIVCDLLLTQTHMGQLAIAKSINTLFVSLYQLTAQPFQPLFLKAYSDGDTEKLLSELNISVKISGLLSSLAFAGFFAFGSLYYRLWIPNQDTNLIWKLTMIGCFSGIFEGSVYPLYYIYTLKIKNKIPCIITIIGGLLNVAGMYFLIKYTDIGVYAVVLTTAVIMTFISVVTNPLYMAHCLKIKWCSFYPAIIRNTVSCCVMSLSFLIVSKNLLAENWLNLIIAAMVCVVLGFAEHFMIAFNKREKTYVINAIMKKVGK